MTSLLDPLEVKDVKFSNRLVMPPMQTGLATDKGGVTDELIDHYTQRSRCLGLLIIEHSYVSREGKLIEKQLGVYDDTLIQGLKRLAESVHERGPPVVLQINHAGVKAGIEITKLKPVAPSRIGNARELRNEDIEALVNSFTLAGERAVKAGFDGVEIHGAHGFLLNQFYSPLTNRRRDKYGGFLENRIRFPLQVVERVREKIGKKLLLYRLGSDDLNPAGTRIEDSLKLALKLEENGVDIIDVSGGICGSRPPQLQGMQGFFLQQAHRIKDVVSIPVIGIGGIRDPEIADCFIRDGKADMIAVGRELLRDPDWAEKAKERLKK